MTIQKISVFCGAHMGKSPDYKNAAEELGELLASKNLEVIFGGGNVGLMFQTAPLNTVEGLQASPSNH
jgi:hypothetical protein